jgi:hypothetical protein
MLQPSSKGRQMNLMPEHDRVADTIRGAVQAQTEADPAAGLEPRANTLVVLVAPELFETFPDPDEVWTTVRSARGAVRLLVRVLCPADLRLASSLMEANLPVEVLAAFDPGLDGVSRSGLGTHAFCVPPVIPAADLDEFALALADVVLTDARTPDNNALLGMARTQQKPIVSVGGGLPPLLVAGRDIAGWLHTKRRHWRYFGCHVFGRVEQFAQELFAFKWHGTARYSFDRLKRSWRRDWASRQRPYFAPNGPDDAQNWRKLVPDSAAIDDTAPIVDRFDTMDHCALHSAYLHRDLIWFVHFASAFAVLFAVVGALRFSSLDEHVWQVTRLGLQVTELVTLVAIGMVIYLIRSARLLDHWTSCRLAAEQLRLARLCLPLFVVPSALDGPDRPRPNTFPFTARALAFVKRAVRDQGLPRPPADFPIARGLAWLDLIVTDQAGYHDDNHRRLSRLEESMHYAALVFYGSAMAAVVAHFYAERDWLLIFTAAGPAFAAALHGVGTRLGIVHRIALSRDTQAELETIHQAIVNFDMTLPRDKAWLELRKLASRAADAMGSENTSWHNLVRREKDDV